MKHLIIDYFELTLNDKKIGISLAIGKKYFSYYYRYRNKNAKKAVAKLKQLKQ